MFIVGPSSSNHIQMWYKNLLNSPFFNELMLFTVHPGGGRYENFIKQHEFNFTKTRFDFIFLAFSFIINWWCLRPKTTNFHYLSSYGLLSLLVPAKNLTLNTWGSDVNLTYQSNNKFKKWLVKLALKRFVWINTPAFHLKSKLIELGAPESIIHVYQYGVDFEELDKISKVNNMSVKKDNDKLLVISNRHWQPLYCIDDVVKGFIHWQSCSNIKAELHLYGTGHRNDILRIKNIIFQAPIPIASRIIIKGLVKKNQMLQQMSNADLFVSIPTRDGTPLSLLEAMVLGLFPIVSTIDANKELLNNGVSEFVNYKGSLSLSESLERASASLESDKTWKKINYANAHKTSNYHVNVLKFQNEMIKFKE